MENVYTTKVPLNAKQIEKAILKCLQEKRIHGFFIDEQERRVNLTKNDLAFIISIAVINHLL